MRDEKFSLFYYNSVVSKQIVEIYNILLKKKTKNDKI